jgi:hypothetical protein
MIGKNLEEIKAHILFHAEQYNILLKIATKQKQQAKYALIFIEQLKNKYLEQMSPEDKQTLDMKFAHFLDQRPAAGKTINRERKETINTIDKQKLALEAMREMLTKKGFDPKELFGSKKEENNLE